jgi:outer membrane immunogenic protein
MHRLSAAFAAAVTAVAFTQVAGAADLPRKAPAYVAPPVYSWTGFYVGATAGGAWSKADVSHSTVNAQFGSIYFPEDIPGLDAIGSPRISGSNAIFGGKTGYNQQWGSLVLGLEGDISWFRFNKTAFTTGNPFTVSSPGFVGFANFNTNVSTTWLATVRPRIGFAVDRALFYGTAGAAFANVRFSNTYLGFSPGGSGNENEASSASQIKTGWVAGGGIDYAVTKNWIVSVEYLHVDLGSISASGLVTTGGVRTSSMNFSTKMQSDLVRAGISYKF